MRSGTSRPPPAADDRARRTSAACATAGARPRGRDRGAAVLARGAHRGPVRSDPGKCDPPARDGRHRGAGACVFPGGSCRATLAFHAVASRAIWPGAFSVPEPPGDPGASRTSGVDLLLVLACFDARVAPWVQQVSTIWLASLRLPAGPALRVGVAFRVPGGRGSADGIDRPAGGRAGDRGAIRLCDRTGTAIGSLTAAACRSRECAMDVPFWRRGWRRVRRHAARRWIERGPIRPAVSRPIVDERDGRRSPFARCDAQGA
jgi:hypothetical protein